jgi:hypothetical protein
MNQMYGDYSAVAHSSCPERLGLLGWLQDEEQVWTPLYPVFNPNVFAASHQLGLLSLDFHWACRAWYEVSFPADTLPALKTLADWLLMTLADEVA